MPRDHRLFYPATQRNRDVILDVLRQDLPETGKILEIASGSGEHCVYFAPHFPQTTWQPTDIDADGLLSIASWTEHTAAANIAPPVHFDATMAPWPFGDLAAVLCINMIHISPWTSCEGLMRGAGDHLARGGILFIYGPFKLDGKHTAPSNESFDFSLRSRDPSWGVRDLADVTGLAARHDLVFERKVAMPANNFSVVFRKQ